MPHWSARRGSRRRLSEDSEIAPLSTSGDRHPSFSGTRSALRAGLASTARLLSARRFLITTVAVAVPAVVLALSISTPTRYEASASLRLHLSGLEAESVRLLRLDPLAEIAGNVSLRESAVSGQRGAVNSISSRTGRRLGLSRKEVSNSVRVHDDAEAGTLVVNASSTEPKLARRLANVYAQEYIKFREAVYNAEMRDTRLATEVRRELAGGSKKNRIARRSLQATQRDLSVLAALQSQNLRIAEAARTPRAPVSPNLIRNTVVATILGLCLALTIAYLLERGVFTVPWSAPPGTALPP